MSPLAILSFLRSSLGHYLGLTLALTIAIGGAYGFGRHAAAASVRRAEKAREARAEQGARRLEAKQADVALAAEEDLAKAQRQIDRRTRILIHEVPAHVPPADDARCTVSLGFVRVFNAAVSGAPEVSKPAGGPDAASSGVALSAVLGTDVENYGVAYDWRAEALAWRRWYEEQRTIWRAR